MKVLHIITGLGPGGAEHQLRRLLRELPEQCEVVTLTNPGAVADAIRADGVPVHDLGMRGNRDLTALPRLVRLIRAGHYDVVHTHLYRAGVYGRLAARLAGVRAVVATEHSLGTGIIEGRPTTRGVRALYRASERLGRVTIAVSGTVADRLADWGVPRQRIRVIPNGIDAAGFRFDPRVRAEVRAQFGLPDGAPVIGAVGRLEPTKRFDRLIRAMTGLPTATLLLAGDGSQRAALEQLAHRRGVADRVRFAGATTRARDLMCAMDVFASPSEQETFGMAIIEALANGLPTVYVTCPPIDERGTATPGTRRVAPDVAALCAALGSELARSASRPGERRGVAELVSDYEIGAIAARVSQLYHEIAPSHPPNPSIPTARPAQSVPRRRTTPRLVESERS